MRLSVQRIGALLLPLLLAPAIAACGGQQAPAGGEATPAPPAPTAAPATAAPTAAAEAPAATDEPGGQPTAPPNQPNNTGPINPDYLEFGVVAHLYYTDRERVLQLTQNAGFDWVRQQIYWRDIEDPVNNILAWDEVDRIVETTNAYGRKLLINVVRSPSAYNATNGLPDDPRTLANFMGLLAERYKGRIHAYEIWNEPNLAHETGGTIVPEDVGRYVEMLKLSYQAIKAVDPEAIVLAAASSSSGVTNPSVALSDEEF